MEFLFFYVQRAFESVNTFFLIECNREQDGFHRIVVALVRGGLRVAACAAKKAIEKWLIFAAKGAAEFCPARGCVVDELNECGNGAAHGYFTFTL
jgi:hypothetical protein